jgi:hypothetical protein
MKITSIHLYNHVDLGFSADVAIDEQWLIQIEDGEFSIPEGDVRCWSDRDAQDTARAEHNADDVARKLSIPKTAAGLRAIGAEEML